jgi:DNA-binding XRE family transcriptional regulator
MRTQDAYTAERALLLSAFGENLRAERKRLSLAREELAEVANVHRNEIGVLERGSASRACSSYWTSRTRWRSHRRV